MSEAQEQFWLLKPAAIAKGITPSRMGQLASYCGNYDLAAQILSQALGAKQPGAYLGAVIRDMRLMPRVAVLAKNHGLSVEKIKLDNGGTGWKVAGVIYDQDGNQVGE